MLGVYNYTVILTYLGMLFSFAGIHFVFSEMDRSFILALLCLMISAVMDMFDGKVASTKKDRTPSEKLFGIQIDSMADIISYGVFPSLIVYKLATLSEFKSAHPSGKYVVICICAAYLLCALIRLSYFNVEEMERQTQTDECRHEYRGLPVTSIALILPFVFIVSYFSGSSEPPVVPCAFLLAVMGLAFITPFKLIKPLFIGKIIMIIIGLMELVLLLCGKAYIRESKTDHNNPSAPQQSLIWDSKVQPETVDEAALEQIPVTEAEVEN
ncbi:CDP-alcohol phosphatidyltransferase family protein [Treponema sp.]|jgi:CDP-diacylglycerol--serine O-phosphatidyltransferase|uniref:CDP-alcohol phosphatidyltransferase family protein n=1 Tax=Treponema sp. TaxID=166 RepID=UPI00257A3B0A|nr:CDP-alcohol phosphatidyltransferase family protein [Treponema sp.]MBE6353282.1 phosphatidylserine synthase [Treponema sp.]